MARSSAGSRIGRRRLLKNAGVCITLPWLPSLLPRQARAQTGAGPGRLLVIYVPNGTTQRRGQRTVPPELLERFNAFSDRISTVRGMGNKRLTDQQYNVWANPHADNWMTLYTGAVIRGAGQENPSFDQAIALDPSHEGSRFRSLAVNISQRPESKSGIPRAIFNTLSWSGPRQPVVPHANPRDLFERLFADGPVATRARPQEQLQRRRLFLDAVVDQIRSLRSRLGAADRLRLEEYLTGVEELDRRTQTLAAGRGQAAACGRTGEANAYDTDRYPEALELMQDLAVRAFQCDLTRVFTFMHAGCAGGGSVTQVPFVPGLEGRAVGWHPLSHWDAPYGDLSSDTELNYRDFRRVCIWHYDRIAEFLTKLRDTPGSSTGSLLDETLVTVGSSLSMSRHVSTDLYQILIGNAGGRFRTGVDADIKGGPPSNLWLTIQQGFGVSNNRFGNSNGTIGELLT